ncbi:Branched-chain amino acid transport system 2 carrier protein [Legionella birminghamensis]|uniref:Branched-chain amino acid transport system carrier protein n=1 Tax=Legionella birminghamensis TaxID=28083 RepID=A0A378I6C7_9GAMM|nr:branched-chain amino acid transport system II carrier protein [Legionella birminghamensis]KTC68718.1 Branched-chain amino acid transport system 2 carrier protein [Legionella birminghamensis]STX30296.1 LIV-II [Legionella birminghamensis]
MQNYKSIFIYGFAIFVMFFGSGNLVFPLQIGFAGENNWLLGFAGLLLTGIFLPLMGLFVIKLYQGSYQRFFSEAGKTAGVLLPLIMLALLGSFGVVPRCITVAYGSVNFLFPQISLLPFSLIFCLITFFFCLNDRVMVKLLGKWMSPVLLLTLIALIGIAIWKSPETGGDIAGAKAFSNGFVTGYQTMDLFASFFFSALIFQQIQQQFPNASSREILRFAIKPSIIGAGLLAIIYLGLVYLGAHYANLIGNISPELMLPAIASTAMGDKATLFMGITMFFSCLTTAVALNNLFARYLSTLFRQEEKFPLFLCFTSLTAFAVSLLDFKGIAAFLAPILQLTYPAVIVLTALCLLLRGRQRVKMLVFYLITALVGGLASLHLVNIG